MTENEKRIEYLILKYARHEPLTSEEMAILQEWRGRSAEHDALPDKFRDEKWVEESLTRLNRIPSEQLWQRISERVEKEKRLITPWYIKVAGAAAGITLIVVAVRAFVPNRPARAENGKELVASIPASEQLFSNPDGNSASKHIVLSDGSEIDLNSGSTIKVPAAFAAGNREIQLDGEARFAVVRNPTHPFSVRTHRGLIQDLGTVFNIKGYASEDMDKVTLLEGAVRVSDGKNQVDLHKRLQQVQLTKEGIGQLVTIPSEEDAIAWQKGMFHFRDTDLRTAMLELSRCYGKKLIYADDDVKGVPLHRFDVPREMPWKSTLDLVMDQEKGVVTFIEKGDTLYIRQQTKDK